MSFIRDVMEKEYLNFISLNTSSSVQYSSTGSTVAMKTLISLYLTAIGLAASNVSGTITIETKLGRLNGSIETSRESRTFYSFKGIQYGDFPRRFAPSVLAGGWTGVRDGTKFGPPAAQLVVGFALKPDGVEGPECLNLNVYTPSLNGGKKLPVVVYIHGAGFQTDTGADYSGAFFMDQDVVYVSINYRLGLFGFMTTEDDEIPGNMGLKDMTVALRWVKENIGDYGGDEGKVLLFGEAAGAVAVALHLVSPMSAGLFHGAWLNSGAALDFFFQPDTTLDIINEIVERLGYKGNGSTELANFMREADIINNGAKKATWHIDPAAVPGPVIEKPGPNAFISEHPEVLLRSGRFNKVPIVHGVMEDQGSWLHAAAILSNPQLANDVENDWNRVAPFTMYYDRLGLSQSDSDKVSQLIKDQYLGNNTSIDMGAYKNLTDMYSDRFFNHGLRKSILLESKHTKVYNFIQGFKGTRFWAPLLFGDKFEEQKLVGHGEDLFYFFPYNSTRFLKDPLPPFTDPRDIQFSKELIKLVASFATNGRPESEATGLWDPVNPQSDHLDWYYLDLPFKVVKDPFEERLKFWERIENTYFNQNQSASGIMPSGFKWWNQMALFGICHQIFRALHSGI